MDWLLIIVVLMLLLLHLLLVLLILLWMLLMLLMWLLLHLLLHFSELRVDIRRWRSDGRLVIVNIQQGVKALYHGFVALLLRWIVLYRRRRIMRCHGCRRWGVVVVVLTSYRTEGFQTMCSIARECSLRQLPGEVAITRGLICVEVHTIVNQVVVDRTARVYRTFFVVIWVVGRDERQFLRHRNPNTVAAKGLLVAVEVFETLARYRVAVHGRVLLVAEGDAGAGDAFTAGFGALRADRALFAAF
jgi:hypothetical protein